MENHPLDNHRRSASPFVIAIFMGTFLGLSGFGPSAEASGPRAPVPPAVHLETLADRAGVNGRSLYRLAKVLKAENAQKAPAPRAHSCAALMRDETKDKVSSRNATVECLAEQGQAGFHEDLFRDLFRMREELSSHTPDRETLRSLTLLHYLSDLGREVIERRGTEASWYIKGLGFQKGKRFRDFAFENGDIVIGVGDSSISSIISQVTAPASRFSHAFLVRVENGKLTTLESLIETGVEELPAKKFDAGHYNALTVLRLRDRDKRRGVGAAAVEVARDAAAQNLPYDPRMDIDSDDSIFCSELVLRAYADALGIEAAEFSPYSSQVRSQPVMKYLKNLGVRSSTFPAPADLLMSPYLEIVSEFRPAKNLNRAWELYIMGDLFFEKLEGGERVHAAPEFIALPLPVLALQLIPSLLFEDARLIPESLGWMEFATLATTDVKIFKPAFAAAKRARRGKSGLIDLPPWELRAVFDRSLAKNPDSRIYLR